jgi:hypothetical protein
VVRRDRAAAHTGSARIVWRVSAVRSAPDRVESVHDMVPLVVCSGVLRGTVTLLTFVHD